METYYIIDAAKYPLVIAEGETLPKGLIPLLLGTRYKSSYLLGPFLVTQKEFKDLDSWFYTDGFYDIMKIDTEIRDAVSMANLMRSKLEVDTEDGHTLFFRYYDPKVFRMMAPMLTEDQLNDFYKHIESISIYDLDYQSLYATKVKNKKLEETIEPLPENGGSMKKIKFPLPTLSQVKCLNKLKGAKSDLELQYGAKIKRLNKLIESNASPALIHAEIERITGQQINAQSLFDKKGGAVKSKMSKLRAKSFQIASMRNQQQTKMEQPIKDLAALKRKHNPIRGIMNKKNALEQDATTKLNKAKLQARNKSGLTKAQQELSKAKSNKEVLEHRLKTADNKAKNKVLSKVQNKTADLRTLQDLSKNPKSVNQGITKVNKLHAMASKYKEKGEKKKKEEQKKKKEEQKPTKIKKSWDLDF